MKKLRILGISAVILGLLYGVVRAGEYTTNHYFYLPALGASGTTEKALYDDTLKATDAVIKANTAKEPAVSTDADTLVYHGDKTWGLVNLVDEITGYLPIGNIEDDSITDTKINAVSGSKVTGVVHTTGDETVTGKKTFDYTCELSDSDTTLLTEDEQIASKKYVDWKGSIEGNWTGSYPIVAADIATGAVTSTKILDETIAAGDIATNAVTTAKILDETITDSDLAANSVKTGQILDGTITDSDLAASSVKTGQILDGTITDSDLADGAVKTAKLADSAVNDTKVTTGISGSKINNVMHDTGAETMAGEKTWSDTQNFNDDTVFDSDYTHGLNAYVAPTADAQFAPKKYVDDQISALAVSVAVDTAIGTSNISTSSSTYADMTDMSVTDTFVAGNASITFNTVFETTTNSPGTITVQLMIDDVAVDTVANYIIVSHPQTVSQNYITYLSAASHTIKIRWKTSVADTQQNGATYRRKLNVISGMD